MTSADHGWHDIATITPPQDRVLLIHDDGYVGKAIWQADGRWLDVECGRDDAWIDPPPQHWMHVPAPPGVALVGAEPRENDREKNRRERRAVAITALSHLLSVAVAAYPDDRPSQQDLNDAFRRVLFCLEGFEGEANDAERAARGIGAEPPADQPKQFEGNDSDSVICRWCGGYPDDHFCALPAPPGAAAPRMGAPAEPKAHGQFGSDATVKMCGFARQMAACEGKDCLEFLNRAKAEADPNRAAILAMYAAGDARNAFAFAAMALDFAEALGWWPTDNQKSDWYLTARVGAEPSPADKET